MAEVVISVQGLSKQYRLGQIGAKTFADELKWRWHRFRGREPARMMGMIDLAHTAKESSESATVPSDIWALRDVSFDVHAGEVLGVIGRNGAGKSTLLKILTRITEPTHGLARMRGRVASLLEVGTGFHPDLTGRENVYMNGAILGMTKKEISGKFDQIVEFSEVGAFIDTPVKRYSSGMYVRLAFAVAAHLEPEILLVDEVLAVGDLGFQRKCIGRMETVARDGRTILFVSHNMAAISSLCSRAILLDGGRLVCDAPASETVGAYIASVQGVISKESLAERTDREGGEKFRFQSLEFLDAATDAPLNVAVSGQSLAIRVGYVNRRSSCMRGVVLSIGFVTQDTRFLCACRSDAVGTEFDMEPDRGVALCRIPRLPLNQGRYYCSVIAYQGGEILDWVKEAGILDVTAGDYYGMGKLPAPALQGVFIDYKWETPA